MMPRRRIPPNNSDPPQPQFPNTPEGQLARVFKQEALNHLREQRLNQAAERLAAEATRLEALLERVQRAEEFTSTAAAAATRAAVEVLPTLLRQMQMFARAEEPEEADEHCPGGFPDEWDKFRAKFVKYELDLDGDHQVFKKDVAGISGVVVRTISRAMEWHGLDKKRHWPPSSWPHQAPPRKPKPNHSVTITDLHGGLLAAVLFGYALLDVVVDGKLDHVMRLLKECGVRLVQQ